MKAKLGELEVDVSEVFSRRLRKEFTGVVQVFSGKRILLVRFQYGYEKGMTSNQLTTMIVDVIPINKES